MDSNFLFTLRPGVTIDELLPGENWAHRETSELLAPPTTVEIAARQETRVVEGVPWMDTATVGVWLIQRNGVRAAVSFGGAEKSFEDWCVTGGGWDVSGEDADAINRKAAKLIDELAARS